MFEDVIVYTISEPGAMGAGGMMEFVTENGELFDICYLSDDTPYQDIKNSFPALKDCYFNGPMKTRPENASKEIVVYLDGSDNGKTTKVTDGWHHIYMGFGNHLVVRDDHYERFSDAISDLDEEENIYCNWRERAIHMHSQQN